MSFETESRVSRTVASTGTATRTQYTGARGGAFVDAVVWWIRATRWLRRAGAGAARWVAGTVTPAGWLVAGVALFGLLFGLLFGWLEFVVAGLLGLVLLVLSVPFLFGGRSYLVDLTLTDERVVAGTDVLGGISVVNGSPRPALPGRIDIPVGAGLVDVYIPFLRSGQEHREDVLVPAHRRGIIEVGPATTVRGDPLGILKREVSWADVSLLYVHPVTTSIPSTSAGFIKDLEGNPTRRIVDSDMSFHAIREYAPGDAQRHVHWKSTAKTGTLMVRQYEESRRSRLAVVLSLRAAEYANDDELEMAVSAAGSLGVRAIRDGRDVGVVAGAEIPEFVRTSMRSIRELRTVTTRSLLDELAAVESSETTMPLADVCQMAAEAGDDISIAFLVCGSTVELRTLQAAALAFPAEVAVVAVVCNPEAEPSFRALGSLSVMTIGVLEDLRHLMARGAQS